MHFGNKGIAVWLQQRLYYYNLLRVTTTYLPVMFVALLRGGALLQKVNRDTFKAQHASQDVFPQN